MGNYISVHKAGSERRLHGDAGERPISKAPGASLILEGESRGAPTSKGEEEVPRQRGQEGHHFEQPGPQFELYQ